MHMFPCVQEKLSTTGVKESNSSGGDPQDLLPPLLLLFPLLPPLSSLSPSSSYHPYTACAGETAAEDIILCSLRVRERKIKRKKENEKIRSERKECERWRKRAFDTVAAAAGTLNFFRLIRVSAVCSQRHLHLV